MSLGEDINRNFGEVLTRCMVLEELSLPELYKRINTGMIGANQKKVTYKQLRSWIRGESMPSYPSLIRLCFAVKRDTDYFLLPYGVREMLLDESLLPSCGKIVYEDGKCKVEEDKEMEKLLEDNEDLIAMKFVCEGSSNA